MADFPNDPSSVTAEEMYPLCLLLVQYHGSDSNFPCKYSCILKLAVHILNKMLLLALGMQSLRDLGQHRLEREGIILGSLSMTMMMMTAWKKMMTLK